MEALEQQTTIMQTALDYQVKYGLIWEEVNEKLNTWSTDQIIDFITNNQPEYQAASSDERKKIHADIQEALQFYKEQKATEQARAAEELAQQTARANITTNTVTAAINNAKNNVLDMFKANFTDEVKKAIVQGAQEIFDSTEGDHTTKTKAAEDYINTQVKAKGQADLNKQVSTIVTEALGSKSQKGVTYNQSNLETIARNTLTTGGTAQTAQNNVETEINTKNTEAKNKAITDTLANKDITNFTK